MADEEDAVEEEVEAAVAIVAFFSRKNLAFDLFPLRGIFFFPSLEALRRPKRFGKVLPLIRVVPLFLFPKNLPKMSQNASNCVSAASRLAQTNSGSPGRVARATGFCPGESGGLCFVQPLASPIWPYKRPILALANRDIFVALRVLFPLIYYTSQSEVGAGRYDPFSRTGIYGRISALFTLFARIFTGVLLTLLTVGF